MCTSREWVASVQMYEAREDPDLGGEIDEEFTWYVVDVDMDNGDEIAHETVGPLSEREAKVVAARWNAINDDQTVEYRAIVDLKRAARDQANWGRE